MKEAISISEPQRGLVQPIKGESTIFQARRIEMADAKEFDTGNAVAIQAKKCTNQPKCKCRLV